MSASMSPMCGPYAVDTSADAKTYELAVAYIPSAAMAPSMVARRNWS